MQLPEKSILPFMALNQEIEIKFRVADLQVLARKLRRAGLRIVTRRTHEMNTLYDLPGEVLRGRQQLLRLRKYGAEWKLTHKAKKKTGRHSSREELQTNVEDGKKMDRFCARWDIHPLFAMKNYGRSGPIEKVRLCWMKRPSETSAKSKVRLDGSMQRPRNLE